MRYLLCSLVLGSFVLSGCGSGGAPPKGTGAATTGGLTTTPVAKTVTPTLPSAIEFDCVAVTVEKGKSAKLVINITRKDSKNLAAHKGEIKLVFDTTGAPGIKIDTVTIPASVETFEVTVKADPDAKGGMVEVTGSAPGVKEFPALFTVNVR